MRPLDLSGGPSYGSPTIASEQEGEPPMIPAAFEYHAPTSLAEATALLARLGGEAKVLSGTAGAPIEVATTPRTAAFEWRWW
jgi:hypothetical protein